MVVFIALIGYNISPVYSWLIVHFQSSRNQDPLYRIHPTCRNFVILVDLVCSNILCIVTMGLVITTPLMLVTVNIINISTVVRILIEYLMHLLLINSLYPSTPYPSIDCTISPVHSPMHCSLKYHSSPSPSLSISFIPASIPSTVQIPHSIYHLQWASYWVRYTSSLYLG